MTSLNGLIGAAITLVCLVLGALFLVLGGSMLIVGLVDSEVGFSDKELPLVVSSLFLGPVLLDWGIRALRTLRRGHIVE